MLIIPPTKQKTCNNPPRNTNIPAHSPARDSLANIWSLIESKFGSLEEHLVYIVSVENKTTEQYEEVTGIIRNTNKTVKSALDHAMSNSALISENTKKIYSHKFDYQTLLERLGSLLTENKNKRRVKGIWKQKYEKILIFQNI